MKQTNKQKKKKKRGNPAQPINTLGRSFYQWLLVGGWTVHEGDLHEYLNLFEYFCNKKTSSLSSVVIVL